MSILEPITLDLNRFSDTIRINKRTALALKQAMHQAGKTNPTLRIFAQDLGIPGIRYGMTTDEKIRDNDSVFEIHGLKIIIDSSSLKLLKGATIEYTLENGKPRFKVNNPNIKKKTCAYKNDA